MTQNSRSLFMPCADYSAYADAASRLRDDTAAPVPFICAGREDLINAARLAASLYDARRRPPRADVGVILPPSRDRLRALTPMLAELARRWQPDMETFAVTGPRSVLIVGLYEDLRSDVIAPLLERQRASEAVYMLTGRDIASLSWMLAKQYVRTAAVGESLLSDVGKTAAAGGVEVLGSSSFASRDMEEYLRGRPWRRIMFHGHGKDDYLNLGDWTLCGLHEPAPAAGPATLRPRCGYGYPCFKPAKKLIKISGLAAAEIVLSSCNSGPLPDSAFYDSRYHLLLSSIDGAAQSVVAAAQVHDSGRPENEAFMRATVQSPGGACSEPNTAERLNASVADMHPYIPFLQYGFPVPGRSGEPAGISAGRAADKPVNPSRELLTASVERALMWLDSGILPPSHPLRPRLAKFLTRYFDAAAVRHLKDLPIAGHELQGDLQSLDYAMARRLAQDPEDPIMHSLEYWGKRSRIAEVGTTVVCGCGRPASEFPRKGTLRAIPDTVCVACARCGYAHMRMASGVRMTTSFPEAVHAGESAVATVRVSGGRSAKTQLGIFVPPYLRDACETIPAAAKVRVAAAGEVTANFALRLGNEAIPQIYYYTVFAIQDLSVALVRTHFGLLPPVGGDEPRP